MQQEFRISHQMYEEHNKSAEPTGTAIGSHTVIKWLSIQQKYRSLKIILLFLFYLVIANPVLKLANYFVSA